MNVGGREWISGDICWADDHIKQTYSLFYQASAFEVEVATGQSS